MNRDQYTTEQPTKQARPVMDALSRLEKAEAFLAETIGVLMERLTPVRLPSPGVQVCPDPSNQQQNCEVADRINRIAERIEAGSANVARITRDELAV